MFIDNQGPKKMSSSKIIANGFEKAEVHMSFISNNIAQMRKLENISIDGKESIALEPGGLHLMLINPNKVPKKNSKVEILMFFENENNAEVVRIEADVRSQEL
jgi:copper(I)-binding protein